MHNGLVPPVEERRLVTVLFADIVGFTGRAETSDPEAIREMQRAYFGVVAAAVERYGGTVEKYMGDAAMAIFGAPLAHDDDAERALHAALGIRAAVEDLAYDLQVRIGVNTGEVVGGAGAGPQAADYTVTGDAVNVAARLEQAAPPGEIYAGGVTRNLAADAFAFESLAPLEVKGKLQPVDAWRLVRKLPERPRLRGGEAPLLGRAREVAAFRLTLDEAAAGAGRVMALVGEAGIGKSRLALEARVLAEQSGFSTCWATARSYAESFPYYLLSQLVDDLLPNGANGSIDDVLLDARLGAEPAAIARWAAILRNVRGDATDADGELLGDLTPQGRQRLLVQVLGKVISARAVESPQLVVLDDLHWADASSVAVIDELIQRVAELPILFLVMYRSGWAHGWADLSFYQQLNLGGLRSSETSELARHLTGGRALTPAAAEGLMHRSGGNPFFLEELLRTEEEAGPGRALPETVYEVLLARIDALPATARQLLQLAAVVGMEFSERMIKAVEPLDHLGEALATLRRLDMIVPRERDGDDATFTFRHPLIHEVSYRSLLVTRRRELHGRIAAWLERHGGEEALSEVAAHYRDSDQRDKAREYLPQAAARAASLGATQEARSWYQASADLLADEPARRAEMLERVAHQAYLMGDMDAAIDSVKEAARLYAAASDELHALDCQRWLGRYYWLDGRGAEAEIEVVAAIEGLERLAPTPELAFAYSYRSQLHMLKPDFEEAITWARRAIEVAEQTGASAALVHAYNNLGGSLLGRGDPRGMDRLRDSLRLALEMGLVDDVSRAYANMSGERIMRLPYEESEAFFEEAIAFDARHAPEGAFWHWHRAGQADLWLMSGRWDEAAARLDEMAAVVRPFRYLVVMVAQSRSLLASYRGRYDEAATIALAAMETASQVQDFQALGTITMALAHAEAGLGGGDAATIAMEETVDRALRSDEASNVAWSMFEAADILTTLASSEPDVAARCVRALCRSRMPAASL